MIFSHITTTPGEVTSITEVREYIHSPLALYGLLDKDNSLLLESAEIDSKDSVKSLILVDCALKIICTGKTVTVTAQSNNGLQLLPYLQTKLDNCHTQLDGLTLSIEYQGTDSNIDEASKLIADNAFSALRCCINNISSTTENPFSLFLGGVFAYDMVANFEQLSEVPDGENSCPDYVFYLAETLVVIDHQAKTTELIGNVFNGPDVHANCFEVGKKLERLNALCDEADSFTANQSTGSSEVTVDISDEDYCQQVNTLKKHIVDGDIFQVVPSRTFSLACANPLHAYSQLKKQNPSPYMFYMRDSEFALFGASPESALKFCADSQQVEVYPIAGTRPRGKFANGQINPDLDSRIELELRNDQKERAEHLMLVDLARNDVARISVPGTRHAKELLKVDRYSQVMHLVSRVVGTLKPELDALHAYQACMNMGTLVGAPKVSAAELVRQTEGKRRGSYGGAVGYLTGDGAMDSCIVIRSAFVKNNIAYVQAGAGVVYDSDPQSEANETRAKAQAVITAIQSTYQGH
ncbi:MULTISPECIES: anthranilate synthase component 1 [Pseudoalteromonas]|uniref:anthranilate synthase component 1 n=1 Tax=Pseudoalteromonas TaxID=53246 RepID=UPI0002ECE646|nr:MULTISPECIES: anthranilate synthase component 1 [Pseudoalteromonas]MCF6142766.1 anthranilate synthase component I [Pseudoalteromonas mariniglutinosa NCIMB 1770]TMN72385.1 anthranilate synthase component 1 [Pseudoalteromonas sp. S1727]BDF94487.1 anthranilate synthase component 1 [Pseudoalteromonas sp. KAN5]